MKPLFKTSIKRRSPFKFLLYFIFTLPVVTLLSSNAYAIPSQVINISINYFSTPSWTLDSSAGFNIFKSTSNSWGTPTQWQDRGPTLAGGGGDLAPGLTIYKISVPSTNLSNIYFTLSGGFNGNSEGAPYESIFVAEPPTGWASNLDAWMYGPPWISLDNLVPGHKLFGDLEIINGYDSQAGTNHPWVVGSWEITTHPVPEPASLILVAAGLAGFGFVTWCRRRKS